jgi:phosphotransferase system  glucose/maltose/N-acetylglucosamine-specific IIC component
MLIAGIISFVICLIFSYELKSMLLVMFISMLVFAIIGTVIKSIVDRFNMRMDYDDLFDDDEDMK